MATKKDTFEIVSKEVKEVCEKHGVSESFILDLTAVLVINLKPKPSGASFNIKDVTKSVDGVITELQCSYSGVFLPATAEFFYKDRSGKGVNGLKRHSKLAEKVRKNHKKTLVATEKAILTDVLTDKISTEEGKLRLIKAKSLQMDFSTVAAVLPVGSN